MATCGVFEWNLHFWRTNISGTDTGKRHESTGAGIGALKLHILIQSNSRIGIDRLGHCINVQNIRFELFQLILQHLEFSFCTRCVT